MLDDLGHAAACGSSGVDRSATSSPSAARLNDALNVATRNPPAGTDDGGPDTTVGGASGSLLVVPSSVVETPGSEAGYVVVVLSPGSVSPGPVVVVSPGSVGAGTSVTSITTVALATTSSPLCWRVP